jgi:hypothetical protein|tara:strand:+ start:5221 stop:5529 length:309 start_codon:yes stop_codon:yes gene_type:complete
MTNPSVIAKAAAAESPLTLAEAPALAMGLLYQSAAHSQSVLFENAVLAQSLGAMAAQAATLQGMAQLDKLTGVAGQAALEKLASADLVDKLLATKIGAASLG